MLKLEFFKTADEFVSKVSKGSVVAYHADHQNYRHMLQLAGSYVGKTKFGFDLAPMFSSLSESGFIPTLGFHDCLSMRLLEREKGNLRNLVLV